MLIHIPVLNNFTKRRNVAIISRIGMLLCMSEIVGLCVVDFYGFEHPS